MRRPTTCSTARATTRAARRSARRCSRSSSIVFLAGSADRLFLVVGVPYETQIWLFRVAVFVVPPLVYVLTGARAASSATASDDER